MSYTRFVLSLAAVVAASAIAVAHAQVISEPEPYLIDQFLPRASALKKGYFVTEEQLKKLTPEARAEFEKLLKAKADQATRMKIYDERVKEEYQKAQDALKRAVSEQQALAEQDQKAYRYMIGVTVEPNADNDDGGVIVSRVLEDSPAETAGVAPGDVILSVEGMRNISSPRDLIAAVEDSEGKEIVLHVKTHSKEGTDRSLKVVPVGRPDKYQTGESEYDQKLNALLRDEWAQAVKQYNQNDLKFRTIHPGVYWDQTALQQDLPENVSITISKSGKAPAKIIVTRDGQSWNMNETEVDQLPEDLRAPVKRLLTRPGLTPLPGGWGSGGGGMVPGHQLRILKQEQKVQQSPATQGATSKELQKIQQQLEALQQAVETLQQNQEPE